VTIVFGRKGSQKSKGGSMVYQHMHVESDALKQRWRTCGPQKNFVRPAKHSGETISLELSL